MDFNDTPEEAAFRKEVRAWLDANATRKSDDKQSFRARNDDPGLLRKAREWQAKKAAAGYARLTWPKEFGGRGASPILQVIYQQEESNYLVPLGFFDIGLGMCIPTMMAYASPEHLKRYVKPALHGEEIWCQLFSEPAAGSDVAGIRTRAERDGDHWVINGQKVWTSGAQYADRMFLLARTDPDAPKHKGISYLIIDDMKSAGVEVRPLVVMNGHHHFNEVFFDNVQIPKENLIGPLNEGWKVTMTTLAFERGMAGGGGHAAQVRRLADLARTIKIDGRPAWDQEWVRQELAQFMIECEAVKYTRLRSLTRQLKGLQPGPEGSTLKLVGSELGVGIARFVSELLGSYAILGEPTEFVPDAPRWQNRLLSSRQYTIAGGTSEIQRNILGERQLGLPKG